MIESSLIAGTQPAGAASLLAGVRASIATGGTGGAAAGVPAAGVAGDGFRERFEASVGLPRLVVPGVEGNGAVSGVWRPVVVTEGAGVSDVVPVSGEEADVRAAGSGTGLGLEGRTTGAVATAGRATVMDPATAAGRGTDATALHEAGSGVMGAGAGSAGGEGTSVEGVRAGVRAGEVRPVATVGMEEGEEIDGGQAVVEAGPDPAARPAVLGRAVSGAAPIAEGVKVVTTKGIAKGLDGQMAEVAAARTTVPGEATAGVPSHPLAVRLLTEDAKTAGDPEGTGGEAGFLVSKPAGAISTSRAAGTPAIRPLVSEPVVAMSDGPVLTKGGAGKGGLPIAGASEGVIAAPELTSAVGAPVTAGALGRDADETTSAPGQSSGVCLLAGRKKGRSAAAEAVLVAAPMNALAPTGLAPTAALGVSVTAPLLQTVPLTPATTPTPEGLSGTNVGEVRAAVRSIPSSLPFKSRLDAASVPVAVSGEVTQAGAWLKIAPGILEGVSAQSPAGSVVAEGEVAPAPAQGLAGHGEEQRVVPGLVDAEAGPVSVAKDLAGGGTEAKAGRAEEVFAEALEPGLAAPAGAPVVPVAAQPVRTAGAAKSTPAVGVAPLSAADGRVPVAHAAVGGPEMAVDGSDKAGTATVAKGGSQPVSDGKGSVIHPLPEAAQNGVAAVVAPQAPLGLVESKVAGTGGQAQTNARAVELAAMAAGGSSMEHTTLVSTPNVLEVGVASGTNGWLKVRAEMDGTGGVAASVVATTASAAEALHKELPALSAYLRDESVGVSSLVVNRAEAGAMAQDATSTLGSGSFGPGSQAGRGGQPGANDAPVATEPVRGGVEAALRGSRFDGAGAGVATEYGRGSGGWLNVVA